MLEVLVLKDEMETQALQAHPDPLALQENAYALFHRISCFISSPCNRAIEEREESRVLRAPLENQDHRGQLVQLVPMANQLAY